MLQLLKSGDYALIETKEQTKILSLDKKSNFAWINADNIGEILVKSDKSHVVDNVLALGKYRLYDVHDEPDLTDLEHLELLVGNGQWQGYLLTTGFPSNNKKRSRIIPTREIITKTTHH